MKNTQLATDPQTVAPLLQQMLEELRKLRMGDDDLWTAEEIAAYMKYQKKTVQNVIIKKPGFPSPYIIPSSENSGGKRWKSGEVKQWAMKHRTRV